jgi:hypothetical protein
LSGINWQRVVSGGLVAGLVLWMLEGGLSVIYQADMEAALLAHGLSFEMDAAMIARTLAISFLTGVTLVFLYAAARPRFGAGPRTALVVGSAMWLGNTLVSVLGWSMLGIFPTRLLVLWGVAGFVQIHLVALAGGWIYREG